MKIDGVDPLQKKPDIDPAQKSPAVTGPSFNTFLNEATGSGGVAGVAGAGATGPVSAVPFLAPPSDIGSNDNIFRSLEGLMTDLDMLKNAIGNTDIPMSRVEPLLNALVERKDEIAGFIKNVPDPELRGILSDAMSLVLDQANQYHTGYVA